jgi:hypothetical protein
MSTNIHFDCLNANETKTALVLNELQNSGFKICIFGAGQVGKAGFEFLKEKCLVSVTCFCDNSPDVWGTKIFNIAVISPEDLKKSKNKMVCVVFDQKSHIEIKKQVVNMGVAHLVPIDLAKCLENEKTKVNVNKNIEYIKTIIFLQNFAPKLLKEIYSGFDIDNDLVTKAAPFAFWNLRKMDNTYINKILLHLINGTGISPETAFYVIQKVSKNHAFKEATFYPMLEFAFRFPKNEKIKQSIKNLYNELYVSSIDLRYVSYLLWQNEEQQALEILQKHIKKIGEDDVYFLLPVAEFVHRTKIMKGHKLDMFAKIFNAIKDNMKNNIIKKLTIGKNVAVVGNGPQEFCKKNGVKIDSHGVVVRFNAFSTDEQFAIDYGKKTDIHVFSSWSIVPDWKKNIKIFAIAQSPYYSKIPQNLQNSFTKAPLDKLAFIGTDEVMNGIYKNYCIGFPSSGAKTIYYLKKVLKANLCKDDVFGMALSSGNVENGYYHNGKALLVNDLRNFFEYGFDNMYAEFEMYKHLFRNDN